MLSALRLQKVIALIICDQLKLSYKCRMKLAMNTENLQFFIVPALSIKAKCVRPVLQRHILLVQWQGQASGEYSYISNTTLRSWKISSQMYNISWASLI